MVILEEGLQLETCRRNPANQLRHIYIYTLSNDTMWGRYDRCKYNDGAPIKWPEKGAHSNWWISSINWWILFMICKQQIIPRWWFPTFFLFTPIPEEMLQFDSRIFFFQNVLVKNHQLDTNSLKHLLLSRCFSLHQQIIPPKTPMDFPWQVAFEDHDLDLEEIGGNVTSQETARFGS